MESFNSSRVKCNPFPGGQQLRDFLHIAAFPNFFYLSQDYCVVKSTHILTSPRLFFRGRTARPLTRCPAGPGQTVRQWSNGANPQVW